MAIQKQGNGIVVDIGVRPGSSKENIEQKYGKIKISIKEPAEKGKANFAIIKLFSRLGPCYIISGLTSRKKKILIGTSEEEFMRFIKNFKT